MRWAHRFLDHADRGIRRLGRFYQQGRRVAGRADRLIDRGARVFHAVSHLLPEENRRQGLKGLATYDQIRRKALETDRALTDSGIVR